jgi:hypothetical protein
MRAEITGPKSSSGQRVVRGRDGERVAEAQVVQHRQVGLQERGEQPPLHDEARVGGAALLGVLEALADVLGEQRPLSEVPHAPGAARGLRDHGVAGQRLDQLGVHLHADRVVPAGDVRDRAGQRFASLGLPVDLLDVPADAVEPAVDVGAGQPPRLADLPDQQQRE